MRGAARRAGRAAVAAGRVRVPVQLSRASRVSAWCVVGPRLSAAVAWFGGAMPERSRVRSRRRVRCDSIDASRNAAPERACTCPELSPKPISPRWTRWWRATTSPR
ncbi:hypothetical protein [Lysobacter gummosus]|uniref:hypothetical protein n=1 Tax=Lysobacter gummosus TaxID=262324 RepID=UPI00362EE2B2